MWAQRLSRPFVFETIEVPAPGADDLRPGEVLLSMIAGGICGSDLPYFKGALSRRAGTPGEPVDGQVGAPLHEIVGRVVTSRHPDHAEGDLVVGWASGHDGLAELVITDGSGLAGYDPELVPTTAVMLQPLACVLYACDQLPPVRGRRVAVIGQGPIGLLFSQVLKQRGAAVVTGVDLVDRSAEAAAYGVDETVTLSASWWAHELGDHERPDVVIEAVGHQPTTLTAALEAVAVAGSVYAFGIPDDRFYALDLAPLQQRNVTLYLGVTRNRQQMLAAADDHLRSHPWLADRYVSHVFAGDQVQDAFDAAIRPRSGQTKITLELGH